MDIDSAISLLTMLKESHVDTDVRICLNPVDDVNPDGLSNMIRRHGYCCYFEKTAHGEEVVVPITQEDC